MKFLNLKNFFRFGRNDSAIHKSYNLNSGERQVGKTLEEIRYDHRVRYQIIIKTLSENQISGHEIFGLDMFCATGYGSWMLSSGVGCSILGVDASLDAVNFANRYFSSDRTFFSHKAFPFILPSQIFDFVACIESIEHVHSPDSLFREAVKALKPGGFLFLSTPNDRVLPLSKNPNPFHYRHFKHEELQYFINQSSVLDLVNWYGQDIYIMNDGVVTGSLPLDQMGLVQREERQLHLYILKKKAV